MDLSQLMDNVRSLHTNIAADVWPEGGILSCSRCGRHFRFSVQDAAHYLAHGWPVCCGHAMLTEPAGTQCRPKEA